MLEYYSLLKIVGLFPRVNEIREGSGSGACKIKWKGRHEKVGNNTQVQNDVCN
jgi:hypothetical protein